MGHVYNKEQNSPEDSLDDVLTSLRRLVLEDPARPIDAPATSRRTLPNALSEAPYPLTPDLRVRPGFEEVPQGMSYEPHEKVDALSAKLAALEAASGDLPHLVASDALAFTPSPENDPTPPAPSPTRDNATSDTAEKPGVARALTPEDRNDLDKKTPQEAERATPEPSQTAASRDLPTAPRTEPETALPVEPSIADLDVLDEDALRDMIGEMVRDELRGELGERITRNVRKLVRRELQRALASEKLGSAGDLTL